MTEIRQNGNELTFCENIGTHVNTCKYKPTTLEWILGKKRWKKSDMTFAKKGHNECQKFGETEMNRRFAKTLALMSIPANISQRYYNQS